MKKLQELANWLADISRYPALFFITFVFYQSYFESVNLKQAYYDAVLPSLVLLALFIVVNIFSYLIREIMLPSPQRHNKFTGRYSCVNPNVLKNRYEGHEKLHKEYLKQHRQGMGFCCAVTVDGKTQVYDLNDNLQMDTFLTNQKGK